MVVDFLISWFVGPFKNTTDLIMREVGWCVGPLKSGVFSREFFNVEGFKWRWLGRYSGQISNINIFMGVGFWVDPNYLGPSKEVMRYDRLVYDFDSEVDPEKAVEVALNYSLHISNKYGITPIVFRSGFKGAHVVIPLSKPTDWEGYQLLWNYFLKELPKEFRSLVDMNMLQWNRLDRVPLTWNIKEGGKALAKIIYPEGLDHKTFSWDKLRGLDPTNITVYKVVLPEIPKPKKVVKENNNSLKIRDLIPEDPIKLVDYDFTPPCVKKWLCELRDTGDLDHYERVNLVLFLKALDYGVDKVVDLFRKYAKDFKENITKYQVEYLFGLRGCRKDWKLYSCAKLKELGICVSDCGVKHPLAYLRKHTKTHHEVLTELPRSLPPELIEFFNDTRLVEFTYEDFRNWLESKRVVNASEWHHWERTLRKLAEEGLLGRKFLVGGEWVDYGSGKVVKPPSKEVRFYFLLPLR